jgi:hypothetical protein
MNNLLGLGLLDPDEPNRAGKVRNRCATFRREVYNTDEENLERGESC